MRLHRFYIGDIFPIGRTITISDSELIHQWKNVFRMKEKSQAILFGMGHMEYTCILLSIDKKTAMFEVIHKELGKYAKKEIVLCAALIKKDNFEIIVQKAVELGVTLIIPIISERSEKKSLNKSRIEKIAIEAAEQCGRTDVPFIGNTISFGDAIRAFENDATIIGFEPKGQTFDAKIFSMKRPILFIGPEGGWTDEEIKELEKNGVVMNLPTFILRAETAAIAALTLAVTLS